MVKTPKMSRLKKCKIKSLNHIIKKHQKATLTIEVAHSDVIGPLHRSFNGKKIYFYFYWWIYKKGLDRYT